MGRRSNAKILLRLPLMKDRSQPYEHQIINIFNKVFRRDVPVMGNCDWGYIEVICWGYQLEEFRSALNAAGKEEFARYALHVTKLEVWPRYPINATGDVELTGVDSSMSYPNWIADHERQLDQLKAQIESYKKTYKVMTGEDYVPPGKAARTA